MDRTFSNIIIKGINYNTEEYIKQLVYETTTDKVSVLKPFVGCIQYPGLLFPIDDSNNKTVQFQSTTYIGLMQFIHPDAEVPLDTDNLPAYTLLEFELDGVSRSFVSIAGGSILAGTLSFKDFVFSLVPTANKPIPFNESALHIVRNIKISGSKFNVVGGLFVNTGFSSGSHTKGYSFGISISGYSLIVQ